MVASIVFARKAASSSNDDDDDDAGIDMSTMFAEERNLLCLWERSKKKKF